MLQQQTIDLLISELNLPDCFTERFRQDSQLQYYVTSARSNPEWIAQIIARVCGDEIAPDHSVSHLAKTFASAMGRWAWSGFGSVPKAVFDRRWAACQSCLHLVPPPSSPAYVLINKVVGKHDDRVCKMCGCNAMTKAKLSTESCPVESSIGPESNRWGEPMGQRTKR